MLDLSEICLNCSREAVDEYCFYINLNKSIGQVKHKINACTKSCFDSLQISIQNKFDLSSCSNHCKCSHPNYMYAAYYFPGGLGTDFVSIDKKEFISCLHLSNILNQALVDSGIALNCVRAHDANPMLLNMHLNTCLHSRTLREISLLKDEIGEIKNSIKDFINLFNNSTSSNV